ncbi:MAG: response regulator [Gammaproteobacteria bacterium]|nr:response regulator [Gammaproteobacteria bacterium]
MSLGKKTVILFLLLGIGFCCGTYVALKLTVFPAFEAFEKRSAQETLVRVNRLLESDLRALEIMNIEYSAWDDTYEYALGQRPEYPDETLDPAYWHSISINLMMILDADGEFLFRYLGDPASGDRLSFDDVFERPIVSGIPAISEETGKSLMQGILNTRIGMIQVVSYPILTSASEGPVAGTLVVGQFLTDDRVRELGERTTAAVSLFAMNSSNVPSEVASAVMALENSDNSVHLVIDDQSVHTYQLLADARGNTGIVLKVSGNRQITQIGTTTVWTATLFLAIASLVFLVAAWLFMHRLITRPVTNLTKLILGMRQSGDLNIDVSTNRSDEVGLLACEFGELATKLQDARHELETARDSAVAMSDAKTDFLARMSHEIRTPMNGVLGMTELLRDTTLNDQQQHFANTIYESAESLLQIINDILDISKIEAGKIELEVAPLNLRNVVEGCLELLAETAHQKGLELVCAISPEAHTYVRGDAVRLRQVLMNLIGNAVKFTEQGEIKVSLVEIDGPNGNFRFEVSDTGVGIRSENAARIFEPFSQEDGSTTRRYGGTGLGLSISKQLVELMGGDIGVDSVPGEGCVFWFTTQLTLDEATSELPQPGLLIDKQVLIVDDNVTNREILSHQLESWGMQVTAAASGPEALAVLTNTSRVGGNFHVMLLDMSMPEMDGLQLARTISQLSAYRTTPIVMLSSLSRADLSAEQLQTGPVDWLTKPVRQARLYDVLNAVLSRAAVDTCAKISVTPVAAANDDKDSSRQHILLADDNAVNRDIATTMLEILGYRVTSVTNGRDAVDAVKKRQHDIVLMDCRMPGMDGYDATRAIRQWENQQDFAPIAIVALTANALAGDRKKCLDAGMDDYVEKPFTKAQLQSVTEKLAPSGHSSANIPLVDDASAQITAEVIESASRQGRILVVDDNVVNQQVACIMLAKLGHDSVAVSSGDDALRSISTEKFDMVLMDCHMPGRSGCETSEEIRRRETQSPEGERVPIIALTADFLESNRQKCVDAEMDDYLTKPVAQEHLRMILARWLGDPANASMQSVSVDADSFSNLGDIASTAIDRKILQEIRNLDSTPGATILQDIVLSYCACSTKSILQLRNAVQDGDVKLIEQASHSVKGASSQIGATLLAGICDELIASVNDGDLANSHALCEQIAIEHSAVITALEKELQSFAA